MLTKKILALFVVLTLCVANAPAKEEGQRPNFLILFADDLGYSDIGCFGGEIETPNLDALAKEGVRATQFYNTARCCPSRASLVTGLYPHQAGIGMMVYRRMGEGYLGNLNDRCVTFAEVLGAAGYQTMLAGKWHAGHRQESRPEVRGFQKFTGVYPHIDSYWKVLKGCDIYRDKKMFIPASEEPVNPYQPKKDFYTTEFFTDVALDYLNQAAAEKEKPFLLHVCYNVPHFPLEAPDDVIAKYRNKYKAGWDKLAAEKLARMKKLGIVPETQTLPPGLSYSSAKKEGMRFKVASIDEPLPRWESLSAADRDELDFRRAMYAAQVDVLDQQVGRIVKRLKKNGQFDNTLILFFSDNGCSGELGLYGMNWGKYTSKNYPEWKKKSGWSISQGQCWARYSNVPFQMYKRFTYEGGIASPFIAHWPKGLKKTDKICSDQIFHLVDVMATLCDASGAKYPKEYAGRKIRPAAGTSMLPYLRGDYDGKTVPERTLYWQHETCAAVRRGNWKMTTINDRSDKDWKLFDVTNTRDELKNVAKQHPELVKKMLQDWKTWAAASDVTPWPETRPESNGRNPWPAPPWK